ncbi:hypothetical protein GQ53DRAFT_861138 [Thozetella sp. PMI_491]|nr:hypothetical protein GQ53DRAFT_861138 [Thozetella sp. PMI_491]
MTETRRKRRRTGRLSCRARHVKCDERKPECERCEAGNIACAGYEQTRRVPSRRPKRVQPAPQPLPSSLTPPDSIQNLDLAGTFPVEALNYRISLGEFPSAGFRADGLPLVALPVNPRDLSRPHNAARPVLAYHQYLFRTSPLLFPARHMYFWQDRLCGSAWETEYIFDAVTTLGTMHRAVLLMSTPREVDQHRGLDTEVVTAQAYAKTVQGLTGSRQETEKSPDVLVAVLLLLTYFECFAGNYLAACGHLLVADSYFKDILSTPAQQSQPYVTPLAHSLRVIRRVLQTAVPSLHLISAIKCPSTPLAEASDHIYSSSTTASSTICLQQLLDLMYADDDIADMIWTSWRLRDTPELEERLASFQRELRAWKNRSSHFLPLIEFDGIETTDSSFDWTEAIIPPLPVSSASSKACFVSALFYFSMGHSIWKKSQLGIDAESNERAAYRSFYRTMQCAAKLNSSQELPDESDPWLSCETLNIGLLPGLHIMGQCCPAPPWRRWVAQHMKHIGQEGVFHRASLATSLEVLHSFETHTQGQSNLELSRYPPPQVRVVSAIVPEADGQHYTAYYARMRLNRFQRGAPRASYCPIGHARWLGTREDEIEPRVTVYAGMQTTMVSCASDWLRLQTPIRDWHEWAEGVDLSLDRVIRDHIRGSQLVPDFWTRDHGFDREGNPQGCV